MVLKKFNPGCSASAGCSCGQCEFLNDNFSRPDVPAGGDLGTWLPHCGTTPSGNSEKWSIVDGRLVPNQGTNDRQAQIWRYAYPDGYKRATVNVQGNSGSTVGIMITAGGDGSLATRPTDMLPFGCGRFDWGWCAKATIGGVGVARFVLQLYIRHPALGLIPASSLIGDPVWGGGYEENKRQYWEVTLPDECKSADLDIPAGTDFQLAIYTCAATVTGDASYNIGLYGLRDSVIAELTVGGQVYTLSQGFGATQYGWGMFGAAFGLLSEDSPAGVSFDNFNVKKTTQLTPAGTVPGGTSWVDEEDLCEDCKTCAFGLFGYAFNMTWDLSQGFPPPPSAYYNETNIPPFPQNSRVVSGDWEVTYELNSGCNDIPLDEKPTLACPRIENPAWPGKRWMLKTSGGSGIVATRQGFGSANLEAVTSLLFGDLSTQRMSVRLYFDANVDFSEYHYIEISTDPDDAFRLFGSIYWRAPYTIRVGNEGGVLDEYVSGADEESYNLPSLDVLYHGIYGGLSAYVKGCRLYNWNKQYECIDLPIHGHGYIGIGPGPTNETPLGFISLAGGCSPPVNWYTCGEPQPPWDPEDPQDPDDPPDPDPVRCCQGQNFAEGDEMLVQFLGIGPTPECAASPCYFEEPGGIIDINLQYVGTITEIDAVHMTIRGGTGHVNPCRPDGGEWLFEVHLVQEGEEDGFSLCKMRGRLYQRGLNECSLYFEGDLGSPNCTGAVFFSGYGNENPTCCVQGDTGPAVMIVTGT